MELTKIRSVVQQTGPFASVYLDAEHRTADAARQQELRSRTVLEELEHQGAAPGLLEVVASALAERPPDAPVGPHGAHLTRAVIAVDGRVLLDTVIEYGLARPLVRHSSIPYLVPLLHDSYPDRPYVAVRVDRSGADITAYDPEGKLALDESVTALHRPVHPVRSGGTAPAGRAFHDTPAVAKEAIRRNTEDVAEEVVRVCEAIDAALVFVIGEVQARTALTEALPERVRRNVSEITTGARAEGGDEGAVGSEEHRHLLELKLAEMERDGEAVRAGESANPPIAVEGIEPVCTALREHNVATLLVTEPAEATVAMGADPTQVASHADELVLGGEAAAAAHECRADEALPFAALAQSADLVWIDQRLSAREGFAALLRHG